MQIRHMQGSSMQRQGQQHATAIASCKGNSSMLSQQHMQNSMSFVLADPQQQIHNVHHLAFVFAHSLQTSFTLHWHMKILVQTNMPVGCSALPDTVMITGSFKML